jgi:hypothetical protein
VRHIRVVDAVEERSIAAANCPHVERASKPTTIAHIRLAMPDIQLAGCDLAPNVGVKELDVIGRGHAPLASVAKSIADTLTRKA